MFELNAFTFLLAALAAVPVLLVFRILVAEMRRTDASLPEEYVAAPWVQEDSGLRQEPAPADEYAFERTHRHLTATARCEVDRPLNVSVSQFVGAAGPKTFSATNFEYTIKRHAGAIRQDALDMGGFSQVPLLLYDKTGNCFTVHRRLSLN